MQFVDSLDFESYVDDVEVRAALEAARNRIASLAVDDEDDSTSRWDRGALFTLTQLLPCAGDAEEEKGEDGGVVRESSGAAGGSGARKVPLSLTEAALKKVRVPPCLLRATAS